MHRDCMRIVATVFPASFVATLSYQTYSVCGLWPTQTTSEVMVYGRFKSIGPFTKPISMAPNKPTLSSTSGSSPAMGGAHRYSSTVQGAATTSPQGESWRNHGRASLMSP